MSISKRLLSSTVDLGASLTGGRPPAVDEGPPAAQPRTGPGLMLAARDAMAAMQAELDDVRRRLERFDGTMPTIRVDPRSVRSTRWANRHESAFATPAFERLKASIEQAGCNSQPILVRQAEPDVYEVAFGHRRHRACLELGLPLLAVVWNGPMSDIDLFLSMDRENREREDPSAYEQGVSYLAAIQGGLFPSQRRLAEALGISHTWVRKAILVAQLPAPIIQAFSSPLDVQPKHAQAILAALEAEPTLVLQRSAELCSQKQKRSAAQVVEGLLGSSGEALTPTDLVIGGRTVGTLRQGPRGKVIISLDLASARRYSAAEMGEAIAGALVPTPAR
jgi:ParB family chromosome partitioning protein